MRYKVIVAAVMSALIAQTALAQFSVVDREGDTPTAYPIETPLQMATRVGEIGDRPAEIGVTKAAGELPLARAIREIAPAGWRGFSRGSSMNHQVRWRTGEVWIEAVDRMMYETGNHAVIDWKAKSVTLFPVRQAKEAPIPVEGETSVQPVAAAAHWRLVAGKSLRDQVEDWAKQSGWTLLWKVPVSWVVPADVEFGPIASVSFPDAITQVVKTLYVEGKSVRMHIWDGNRVAEITSAYAR